MSPAEEAAYRGTSRAINEALTGIVWGVIIVMLICYHFSLVVIGGSVLLGLAIAWHCLRSFVAEVRRVAANIAAMSLLRATFTVFSFVAVFCLIGLVVIGAFVS